MNIFITTDTHFNHYRIIEYEDRPTNFKELIINNWDKVIKDDDLVIHLGDVIFSRRSELKDIINSLKGTKVLTRGNHDHKSNVWFMNNGFDFSCDEFKYNHGDKKLVFSHKPVEIKNDEINIHGHFHNHGHLYLDDYPFYTDRHINVSLEENKYRPIPLNTILNEHNKLPRRTN